MGGGGGKARQGRIYIYSPPHCDMGGGKGEGIDGCVCVRVCVGGGARRSEEEESFGAYVRESPIPSHPIHPRVPPCRRYRSWWCCRRSRMSEYTCMQCKHDSPPLSLSLSSVFFANGNEKKKHHLSFYLSLFSLILFLRRRLRWHIRGGGVVIITFSSGGRIK